MFCCGFGDKRNFNVQSQRTFHFILFFRFYSAIGFFPHLLLATMCSILLFRNRIRLMRRNWCLMSDDEQQWYFTLVRIDESRVFITTILMDNICLGEPIHIHFVLISLRSCFMHLLKCYVTCYSTLMLILKLDIGGAIHDSSVIPVIAPNEMQCNCRIELLNIYWNFWNVVVKRCHISNTRTFPFILLLLGCSWMHERAGRATTKSQ